MFFSDELSAIAVLGAAVLMYSKWKSPTVHTNTLTDGSIPMYGDIVQPWQSNLVLQAQVDGRSSAPDFLQSIWKPSTMRHRYH